MPDTPHTHEELVDLLGRLPIHDLDPALSERLRACAHARLARTRRSNTFSPALVPVLARAFEFAAAGILAAGNLAWAVFRSLELLT